MALAPLPTSDCGWCYLACLPFLGWREAYRYGLPPPARHCSPQSSRYAPLVKFPKGSSWLTWQRAYRYGLLVIVPPPEVGSVLDPIRERLDPVSAAAFGAHITVTPPFAAAPSAANEERVQTVIRGVATVRLQLDRPTQFSGSSVVYLPVVPSHGVYALRTALLATGLFRLDLPHTSDFVPHLTLSEFGSAPDEAFRRTSRQPKAMAFPLDTVAWVVPDEAISFHRAPHVPPELGPRCWPLHGIRMQDDRIRLAGNCGVRRHR